MLEIILGVTFFTSIVLLLVSMILASRRHLLPTGDVAIIVNDQKELTVPVGGSLLSALGNNGIYVSSACGGGGTCGLCRVRVLEGGGAPRPTEQTHLSRSDVREGERLSCQVPVKRDMKVKVPEEVFESRRWNCKVRSNRNVATFIKELVLELPEGEEVDFQPGGFIQIECPPHELSFRDFDIDERFRSEWEKYDLFKLTSRVDATIERAYSMANYPGEKGIIMLNVRVATPPPKSSDDTPPGKVSSWIFNLKPGDDVTISGPFGDFFVKDTDAEMVYIGGGAGMAPLRSHIFELFKNRKTSRKVSYWYGGRSEEELFYVDHFREIEREFPNFEFHIALSDPKPDGDWDGSTGFIHQVLHDEYLKDHPAPEDCEYYICGPPPMLAACRNMLDDLGVESDNIAFDDFGG